MNPDFDEFNKVMEKYSTVEEIPKLLGYIAIDQYGHAVELTNPSKPPKAQLMEYLGVKSAQPLFADTKSGETKHVGYVIGDNWYTIYNITEWTGKAR